MRFRPASYKVARNPTQPANNRSIAAAMRGQLLFHSAFAREFAHRLVALPSLGWHHWRAVSKLRF